MLPKPGENSARFEGWNSVVPVSVSASTGTAKVCSMSIDEGARVGGSGPSLIQASLGFTLSLVTLVGCVVGLGMTA